MVDSGNRGQRRRLLESSGIGSGLRQHEATQRYRPKVFISYARKDFGIIDDYTESLYKNVSRALSQLWIDRDFLSPGVVWAPEIDAAIENAEIFVLFVTYHLRDNSYCFTELAHAVTKNKRILGVLVGCPLTPMLQDKFFPSRKFWRQSRKTLEIFRDDDPKVRGDNPKAIVLSVPLNEGRADSEVVDLIWNLISNRNWSSWYLDELDAPPRPPPRRPPRRFQPESGRLLKTCYLGDAEILASRLRTTGLFLISAR